LDWRWTARRWVISAFLIFHVTTTAIWVLPACPIRQVVWPTLQYYMVPLGLWQFWAMFAPDPMRDTITLEAEVIDKRGLRQRFAFPKVADYDTWHAIPKFRHSKYTANVSIKEDDFNRVRRFAARHVVRSLQVPADAFPVDVHLFYQIKETPVPGTPPDEGIKPIRQLLLETYAFAKPSEVWP
jgi:hypothetical protein